MNRFGIEESKWDAAKVEAKSILKEYARRKDTIAYSEIAEGIRSVRFEPHDFRLFGLLGEISTEESTAGRGMLSALVVVKGENTPGLGFFELAKKLGYDVKEHDVFWAKEVKRVYAAWDK
jgi:hypothetical protein